MRKIVILAFALACVLSVKAEFVRQDVAARYAQKAMGMSVQPQADDATTLRAASRDGKETLPRFYVFNNPDGGWMIISADDRISPVLAYSDNGQFQSTDMPENLEWWIDGVERSVDVIRNSDYKASAQVVAAWKSQPVMDGATGRKVLETANWDQEEPYNMLCPVAKGENERSLVGCVAVAAAIVMRYNKWPAHGKGVVGGYTTPGGTYIPAYSLNSHTYNWDDMPLSDCPTHLSDWTEDQLIQVAQLLHDCGVMSGMDYSAKFSGAFEVYTKDGMVKNMSYSSESIRLLYKSNYDADKWLALMKKEIDEDRVIFYGGESETNDGHAFVCDGYDDTGKLHFNWGWGGISNGYFAVDLGDYPFLHFNKYQDAIIGICPDNVHIEQTEQELFYLRPNRTGRYGLRPNTDAKGLTVGSRFTFTVGEFITSSVDKRSYEFKICLFDKDGNIKQEGWNLKADIEPATVNLTTQYDVLTVTPELGDAFIFCMKQPDGSWTKVKGSRDAVPDQEYVSCGVIYNPVILLPDDYSVGQTVDLKLSLCIRPVKSVRWSVNGQASDGRLRLESGKTRIRADVTYVDDSHGYILRTVDLE